MDESTADRVRRLADELTEATEKAACEGLKVELTLMSFAGPILGTKMYGLDAAVWRNA